MSLSRESIYHLFKETEALLEGHFLLTSGLHSNAYFQCAKVFQYPWHAERLCSEIADYFKNSGIDVVVSPAVGGIVMGQEVGRLLNVRSIFMERVDGRMTLRRGFQINPGERVLVVESIDRHCLKAQRILCNVAHLGPEVFGLGPQTQHVIAGFKDVGQAVGSLLEKNSLTQGHLEQVRVLECHRRLCSQRFEQVLL